MGWARLDFDWPLDHLSSEAVLSEHLLCAWLQLFKIRTERAAASIPSTQAPEP